MKIATPPRGWADCEPNLSKQEQVVNLVFSPLEDAMIPLHSLGMHDYMRAHSPEHTKRVMGLATENGFGDFETKKLNHAHYSCEAMYSAAKAAVQGGADGIKVAFAPVSGFHHAGYTNCGGFCTFNGLMIAAMKLRAEGLLPKGLLIIDGDGHYGDGTEDIINAVEARDWVTHVPLDAGSMRGRAGDSFRAIHSALMDREYSMVIYQAGADAHQDDPYDVGYLSDLEWAERDIQVFSTCKELDLPVVWNLAGGYNGAKTLTLHCRTFMAALQVFYPNDPRVLHKRIPDSTAQELSRRPSGLGGPSGTVEPPSH